MHVNEIDSYLDNISITDDMSMLSQSILNIDSQIEVMKKVFDINQYFEDYDDVVFFIQDDPNVNWTEISKHPKLPEFIMEEFAIYLDWYQIITHRKMVVRTIAKFDRFIKQVFKSDKFFVEFKGERNIAKIMLNVMSKDFVLKAIYFCDKNRYFDSFEILFNHNKLVIKLEHIINSESALIIFKHYAPTSNCLMKAIENNNVEMVRIILQDGRIRPTRKVMNFARMINYELAAIISDYINKI